MKLVTAPEGTRRASAALRRCASLLLVVACACACATGWTQSPASPLGEAEASLDRVREALDRSGDLTLRDSTIQGALMIIGELWRINVVVGEVEGTVNGVFQDAPLREILDSILLSNGYAYRPVGGSLVVSRIEELGRINPYFVSDTIPVGAASVEEVLSAAELLSTPQGQVRALPSAKAILAIDFPDRVAKIRELVRQIDEATRGLGGYMSSPQELEVAYFHTHYIPAEEARIALTAVLSPVGQMSALSPEDRLLVVDYGVNVRMVESVLARIDRPRPQVNIKALIYDISLTDLEEIGVNWNLLSQGVDSIDENGNVTSGSGIILDTLTKAPFDAGTAGGSFTVFSLENNITLDTVILLLQQADDSRLLADPNVTVLDNETAKIESISEIPFQQLTQTAAGGQIGTTAFKEAGIKLEVLPKIARDHTIDMMVTPEFSRLAGFTPNDNQPIIDTRRATTRVRVSNGQTLMIAGLRQRSDVGEFSGIPVLKDVRFLGHLFRARDTQIIESELVVFMTPEIVGYSDPLGERDQLSADATRCRLDRIPAAEGCPPYGGAGGEDCESCREGEVYDPAQGHAPTLPQESTTEPLPEPGASSEAPTTPYPSLPSASKSDSGVTPASLADTGLGTAPSQRMPDYDARFQGTGPNNGKRSTVVEFETAEPLADNPRIDEPWYQRWFWR